MSGPYHALRRRSVRGLAGRFPAGGLVVDLGCGTGALAIALADGAPGRRVLAVDHAPARVRALAAARGTRAIETRLTSIETFEIPPAAGIALVDVLHYLDTAAQDALLARAARALRPGGLLLLRDPDAGAGLRFLLNRAYERLATATRFTRARIGRYRRAADWARALAALGLEVTLGPRPRGPFADRIVEGRKP